MTHKNNFKFLYYINKNEKLIFMNTLIIGGIFIEIFIAISGIYLIKNLQKRQTRQPSLSKNKIRNLKF